MNAATRAGAAPELLAELKHAHAIIKAMLNAMTIQQKSKVHEQLDKAGVSGEGMTRANERLAVIEAADAQAGAVPASASSPATNARLLDIEAQAVDIGAQGQDIEILLQALFEKLDDIDGGGALALAAINCFATCAARNASLMREAAADIVALVREGGAA